MPFFKSAFPIYLQHEKADCGPTCIRMILKFYGNHQYQESINKKFRISSDGVSMYDLAECARQFGLEALPVKMPLEQLKKQPHFPCIAHFHGSHFVIIIKIKSDIFHLADPARGFVKMTLADFTKNWTANALDGVVLFLSPTDVFNKTGQTPGKNALGMSFFLGHFKKNWKDLLKLGAFLAAGSIIQLAMPLLTQAVVDKGIQKKDFEFLYLLIAAQVALVLGRVAVEMGRSWFLIHVSNRINVSIITEFLHNLMHATISFFDQRPVGDILRRIEDNVRLERFLSTTSFSILFAAVNLVVYSALLASYQLSILIVFFLGSLTYFIFILQFMRKRKRLDYLQFAEYSRNESGIIEIIEGIRDIKLNQSEKRMVNSWRNSRFNIFKINLSFTRLYQWQTGGGALINESRNAAITFLAAQAVINGNMTFGMMLAMQYIIGQLNSPVNEFLNFAREYQEAAISFERINTVNEASKEEPSMFLPTEAPIMQSPSVIEFKNVDFDYGTPGSKTVLSNINVIIPIGKFTAIVGESGSGKTTLLNLLLKFYKPNRGSIYINGVDLDTIKTESWRKTCGAVMQNGYIFSDSLERNIALSSDIIDQERLATTIQIASLNEVFKNMPEGMKGKVGNEGQGLSAGQRQRILIARAVYKDPELLLFDEATSSLDAVNESLITNNIRSHFKDKTVITIAHRLSTVMDADNIVVLEKGEIKEMGTHIELIKAKGTYYSLIMNQLNIVK